MVQWLGLSTFTAVTWVQSLVGELRCHKPCGQKKKKKNQISGSQGLGVMDVFDSKQAAKRNSQGGRTLLYVIMAINTHMQTHKTIHHRVTFTYVSTSKLGVILPIRGYLGVPADIFCSHTGELGATGTLVGDQEY